MEVRDETKTDELARRDYPSVDSRADRVADLRVVELGAKGMAKRARMDVTEAQTEHSAGPLKLVPTRHSVTGRQRPELNKQPVENKNNVVQLNTQRGVVFDKSKWKRSRKKPGYLIRRMTGYSIAETEYGVSYLWVLSRKPDRTTADNSVHPLAGYFNWKALESSGALWKERKYDKRDKTAVAAS